MLIGLADWISISQLLVSFSLTSTYFVPYVTQKPKMRRSRLFLELPNFSNYNREKKKYWGKQIRINFGIEKNINKNIDRKIF